MPSEWPYTGEACILIERDSIGVVDHDVWTLSGADGEYVCEDKRRWEGTISTGHMTDHLSATYATPFRICIVDEHGLPAELPATKWTISDGDTSEVVEFVDEGEQNIVGTGTVRVYTTESPIFIGEWDVYTEPVIQKVPCTPPCAYGLAHYCAPSDVPATVSDLEAKQNVLTAGDNVSIVDDVISVPLDAGDGIAIDTEEDVPYLYVKLADENPGLDFDAEGGLKATGGGGVADAIAASPVLEVMEGMELRSNVAMGAIMTSREGEFSEIWLHSDGTPSFEVKPSVQPIRLQNWSGSGGILIAASALYAPADFEPVTDPSPEAIVDVMKEVFAVSSTHIEYKVSTTLVKSDIKDRAWLISVPSFDRRGVQIELTPAIPGMLIPHMDALPGYCEAVGKAEVSMTGEVSGVTTTQNVDLYVILRGQAAISISDHGGQDSSETPYAWLEIRDTTPYTLFVLSDDYPFDANGSVTFTANRFTLLRLQFSTAGGSPIAIN